MTRCRTELIYIIHLGSLRVLSLPHSMCFRSDDNNGIDLLFVIFLQTRSCIIIDLVRRGCVQFFFLLRVFNCLSCSRNHSRRVYCTTYSGLHASRVVHLFHCKCSEITLNLTVDIMYANEPNGFLAYPAMQCQRQQSKTRTQRKTSTCTVDIRYHLFSAKKLFNYAMLLPILHNSLNFWYGVALSFMMCIVCAFTEHASLSNCWRHRVERVSFFATHSVW